MASDRINPICIPSEDPLFSFIFVPQLSGGQHVDDWGYFQHLNGPTTAESSSQNSPIMAQ